LTEESKQPFLGYFFLESFFKINKCILFIKTKLANTDNPIITLAPNISINDGSGAITNHDLSLEYTEYTWLY